MLIMSQNKSLIFKFKEIKFIKVEKYFHGKYFAIYANYNKYQTMIGYYEKEERANEVLMEIINSYKEYRKAEYYSNKYYMANNIIYQIPEK